MLAWSRLLLLRLDVVDVDVVASAVTDVADDTSAKDKKLTKS